MQVYREEAAVIDQLQQLVYSNLLNKNITRTIQIKNYPYR